MPRSDRPACRAPHVAPRLIGVPIGEPEEFSVRQWPDWGFWRSGHLSRGRIGRGRILGVVVTRVALLGLLPRATEIADAGYGSTFTGVLLVTMAGYGVGYPLAVWFGPMAVPRRRVVIVAVLVVLGLAPAVLLGAPGYLTDLTFAVAVGFMLLPLRYSLVLGVATAAGQIAWMWLGSGTVVWGAVVTFVGATAVVGAVFALMFTIGHLRAAREQVRFMAVTQERERVARDLHDVLGHSLSTMSVKLGLARRVLETSGDVERATAEIRDLEILSREALSDIRATVSDYRAVTLAAELAGARVALSAAGVQAEMPAAVDDLPAELQRAFGFVVREAVTNVLRHSDATHCRIRLGRHWVEITDNGSAAPEPGAAGGHGLTGLAERMLTVSGTLEHGRRPTGGFRVLAHASTPSTDAGPA